MSLSLLLLLLVCSAQASHFLGTVMTYHPETPDTDGSVRVAVRYQLSFRSCAATASWSCHSGHCGNESFVLEEVHSDSGEWCQRQGQVTQVVPTNAPFQLLLDGGDWINDTKNGIKSSRAVTLVELKSRSDTGTANTSPQTTILPAVRVPSNCQRDFNLLAFDPDGDEVKCRYGDTSLSECNPCTPPSVLSLSSSCSLSFDPTSSTNEGAYAVQLVMEDFPRQTITLTQTNGVQEVKTTTDAISKIPVQFVVWVDPAVQSCTEGLYLPRFLPPTPANGAQLYTPVTQSLDISIQAEAHIATVSELVFSGPHSITQTASGGGHFTLRWTPSEAQDGESHSICFVVQADDNLVLRKYHSELRCVTVTVGPDPTTTTQALQKLQQPHKRKPRALTNETTPAPTTIGVTTTASTTAGPPTMTTIVTPATTAAQTTTTTPSTTAPPTSTTITTPVTTTRQTTTTTPSTTAPPTSTTITTPITTTRQTTTTTPSTTAPPTSTTITTPVTTTRQTTTTTPSTTAPPTSTTITTPITTTRQTTTTTPSTTAPPTSTTITTPITTTRQTTTTTPSTTAPPTSTTITTPITTTRQTTTTTPSTTAPPTSTTITTPVTTTRQTTTTTPSTTAPPTSTTITTPITTTRQTTTTTPSTTAPPTSTTITTPITTTRQTTTTTPSTTAPPTSTTITTPITNTTQNTTTTPFTTAPPTTTTITSPITNTTQTTTTTPSTTPAQFNVSGQFVIGVRVRLLSPVVLSEEEIRTTLIAQLDNLLRPFGLPAESILNRVSILSITNLTRPDVREIRSTEPEFS